MTIRVYVCVCLCFNVYVSINQRTRRRPMGLLHTLYPKLAVQDCADYRSYDGLAVKSSDGHMVLPAVA